MSPSRFDFRRLREDDLPAVHRWMNAPHAVSGMGGASTPEEVADEYLPAIRGEVPIHAYVALHEGRAVGLVEWCRLGDFPDLQEAYAVTDPDAANCDILLGEPDAAHRGLGPPMIEAFLSRIVFADPRITSCVIDPRTDNFIAIRAYEKVGFRFVRAMPDDLEGASVHLLELRRDELGVRREPAAAFTIRPARPGELAIAVDIDDDACALYRDVGLLVALADDDPFSVSEVARWSAAAAAGRMLLACAPGGEPIGFAALGWVDGRPHLEQLSVRRAWMRRGVGRALLARARHWSVRPGALTITTYDGLVPWNEPWYARSGFSRMQGEELGPELLAILEAERRALPAPEHRVAMIYRHAPGPSLS